LSQGLISGWLHNTWGKKQKKTKTENAEHCYDELESACFDMDAQVDGLLVVANYMFATVVANYM